MAQNDCEKIKVKLICGKAKIIDKWRTMWTTQIQLRLSPVLSPLISARRTPAGQADKIGGLGLDILTIYKSKRDAVRPLMVANSQPNQNERQEEEGQRSGTSQLRGSDVLLALQQAATRRRREKNKSSSSSSSSGAAGSKSKSKKGATWSGGSDDDDDVEENDHVGSSLMIKSDWCKRIEDLERRLQELSGF